jgi:hypothetical protein
LLALYAKDPRWWVQEEIARAWAHFDPQRYAEEVLADAPLAGGEIFVNASRMLPHLAALRHRTSVELWLPDHEPKRDLTFATEIDDLRYLRTYLLGRADLSPLSTCERLEVLFLYGGEHYLGLDRLPENLNFLGLNQSEPWRGIGFLRDRALLDVELSQVAADCDISVLTEMPSLHTFGCRNWHSYGPLAGLSNVRRLQISNGQAPIDLSDLPALPDVDTVVVRSIYSIDLRALAGRSMRLELSRRQRHIGLDELGPDVAVTWSR